MVRSEDPAGAVKHLRFGNYREELLEALKSFPGVKCIVLHTHGKKGEHPHLHVWYEVDVAVTNQAVRNRLKKHNPLFLACNNQNDWSMRNHDSWETWAAYVCSNMSHRVLLSYRDIDSVSESKQIPIAVGPLHSSPPPAIVIKKTTMRDKFIRYLEHERGWKRGETNPMPYLVVDAATEFWQAAFTNPECIRMCRYAMYVFSDEDARVRLTERIFDKINHDL